MAFTGSTTFGPTTLERTPGLLKSALVSFPPPERATLLLSLTTSCTSSVDELRMAKISETLRHSEYPPVDGTPSKTWARLHPPDRVMA